MSNKMKNFGYCYYHDKGQTPVDYGRSIVKLSKNFDKNDLQKKYNDLQKKYFEVSGKTVFTLDFKISYLGLLIGLGYDHPKLKENTDAANADFAAGFMFDHTTGFPYIPGSSVKGILRSVFPGNNKDEGRKDFINELLNKNLEYKKIEQIENRIFGNRSNKKRETTHKDQDIFYDGYISKSAKSLFAEEYITPHPDDISDPNPIKLLKIPPDNIITLQFGLNDNKKNELTQKERLKLYCQIILYKGLGAKTNVGFGQFDESFARKSLEKALKPLNEKQSKTKEASRDTQRKKEKEQLAKMSPVDRIFKEYKQNVPKERGRNNFLK